MELEKVVDDLLGHDLACFFNYPISEETISEYQKYREVVVEPMDLSTIKKKIEEYKSFEDFDHDVKLVFNNAIRYNNKESMYSKAAGIMLKYYTDMTVKVEGGSYADWMRQIKKCVKVLKNLSIEFDGY